MTNATQRLASLHDARETFFKALKAHEHSIYQLGYEDGFTAGWEAALHRLAEVRPDAGYRTPKDFADVLQGKQEEIPARDALMGIIEHSPGMLRQEIVSTACERISTLNERTVRTALHRMKTVGELIVEDNRWYVAEKPKSAALEKK